MLYVTGEHIHAGAAVFISGFDGKAYSGFVAAVIGKYLGDAVEELRKGFRVVEREGEVREDDA
jgi:hypothetical protein